MEETLPTRIRKRLEYLGKSARSASLEAGLGADAIRSILDGRSRSPRIDTLSALANALDCSVAYLLGTGDDPGAPPWLGDKLFQEYEADRPPFHPATLILRHKVAAGIWLSTEEWMEQSGPEERYPVIDSPGFLSQQWLEQTTGPSSDRIVPEGAMLHVVDVRGMEYAPRPGDIVVVERTRNAGTLRERSLRRVAFAGAKLQLLGDSSVSRHNGDLAMEADKVDEADDLTTEIAGLVIRAYMHFVKVLPIPAAEDPRTTIVR